MAGSVKWMIYTADDTNTYSVLVDESNGEQTGFLDVTGTADPGQIPRYMKMRAVNGVSSTGQRRSIPVGDPTNALWTSGGSFTIGGVTYNVTSRRGEKSRFVLALDTGLDDGDAT